MALRAQITGAITDPVLRWTPKQQPVLDLRINATASQRDKSTGRWEDIGAPFWVSVAFWDQEAQHLEDVLNKGDRITVEGTLVLETYQRRDNTEGTRFTLRYPKLLGIVPRRSGTLYTGSNPVLKGSSPAHTEAEPWETAAPLADRPEAPF